MKIIAVVALGLAAIGCTSVVPVGTPAPAATPQIIYITPAPVATQVAVATPTRRPTPEPEPEPTVELDEGYFEFLTASLEWLGTIERDATAIGDYRGSDLNEMWDLARTALSNAEDVQSELKNITPSQCYEDWYDATVRWIDKYVEALTAIEYGLTPPVTTSDIDEGTALLEDAFNLMDAVTREMEATECI
jgi:hypothetical protein